VNHENGFFDFETVHGENGHRKRVQAELAHQAKAFGIDGQRLIEIRGERDTAVIDDQRFLELREQDMPADWRAKRGALGSLNLFRTMFGSDHFPKNLAAVEDLQSVAARHGKTMPQLALSWAMGNRAISTALVGFRRPEEVEENLGALGWKLSAEELAEIDAIFARHHAITEPEGWLEDDPPANAR